MSQSPCTSPPPGLPASILSTGEADSDRRCRSPGPASGRSSAGGRPPADCPNPRSSASVAENHAAHLIAQASDFFRVGGTPEALGQFEEFLLFALLRLHPALDEFHQHPVGAHSALFRQGASLGGDVRRQANALPYRLVCRSHSTIMHQRGANRRMRLATSTAPLYGRGSRRR